MSRWLLILFAVIAGWFPPTAAQAITRPHPAGCDAPRHPANDADANFTGYDITSIKHKVVDLTVADDLFGSTNFVALYERPQGCLSNAISFLRDGSNSDKTKMIVVYSLQKLQIDGYVGLELQLFDMAAKGEVSGTLFDKCLFPELEKTGKLQCNFEKENVKNLLTKLSQSDLVNLDNKAYIKSVLAGDACREIKEFQELNGAPKY